MIKQDNVSLILEFLKEKPESSSGEIYRGVIAIMSYASVKRLLSQLLNENTILAIGKGRATKYKTSLNYQILGNVDVNKYFEKEIDERVINKAFNFDLIKTVLSTITIFNDTEKQRLNSLQARFTKNIAELSTFEYDKELERLAIDLSWKSSQIEGNTYSLLETEYLLKEQKTAFGKTKDEATMLLNHKECIDFIVENKDYLQPLTVSRIEDVHSILMKNLGIQRNIRIRKVGISGTNYTPLDNEHQIREAIRDMCDLINAKESVFDKAFLSLLLLSYIQPFADGNKRTARIVSNALLMVNNYCPISFRTIDPIEYKKAMLIFYEQNNLYPMKDIFISQFHFAVNTYF
jgi:Fic family protein